MGKPGGDYVRLTRPYFGLNGTSSIWLGQDHLLQITNVLGWESYRRWFLRDIQALVARRNVTRLVCNMVVGFGGLFIATGAGLVVGTANTMSAGTQSGFLILASIMGVIAAVFIGIALFNTLLGPGCAVYVQTPHGMERLSGPGRIPAFEQLVNRIKPRAEQVQERPWAERLREGEQEINQATTR